MYAHLRVWGSFDGARVGTLLTARPHDGIDVLLGPAEVDRPRVDGDENERRAGGRHRLQQCQLVARQPEVLPVGALRLRR
eukprot:6761439-Prymnesium_polylepis.1